MKGKQVQVSASFCLNNWTGHFWNVSAQCLSYTQGVLILISTLIRQKLRREEERDGKQKTKARVKQSTRCASLVGITGSSCAGNSPACQSAPLCSHWFVGSITSLTAEEKFDSGPDKSESSDMFSECCWMLLTFCGLGDEGHSTLWGPSHHRC